MIRLEGVVNELFGPVSFEIKTGSVCKIITSSEEEKDSLLHTLLALERPLEGRVFISGMDVLAATEDKVLAVYRKFGVAWKDGGLISNLKAGENIMLPLLYHRGMAAGEAEDRAAGIFGRLGVEAGALPGLMSSQPGLLPSHEKMFVGLVRMMLMEPDIIIYDSILDGLGPEMAGRVAGLAGEFHSGRPGRTSVYLSPAEHSLDGVFADTVIRQQGRGFQVWA